MEISRHWRLRGQRYGLTGTICSECGKPFFSPHPVCDACNGSEPGVYRFDEKRQHHAVTFQPAQR